MFKLLIAEDENKTRSALKHCLPWDRFGVEAIAEASDGRKALELAKAFQPDLVITDIRMPEMDGIELAKQLLAMDKQVGIIIVTAYDDFAYLKSAIRVGVVDYIMKPVDIEELDRAVHKALDRRGETREQAHKERVLHRNLPLLQEDFIRSMVNRRDYRPNDWSEQLAELQLASLQDRELFLYSIVQSAWPSRESADQPKAFNPSVLETIRQQAAHYEFSWAFHNGADEILLVVSSENFGAAEASDLAKAVREAVLENCYLEVEIAYSPKAWSLETIPKGFRELRGQLQPIRPEDSGAWTDEADRNFKSPAHERDSWFVHAVKNYISEHYREERLTIADIAKQLRYTDAYVCTIFKKESGITLNQYLNLYRIAKAKQLLLSETKYKMSEIAECVGYSNENYFSKVFRKYEGVSPSDYRDRRGVPER